MSSDIHTIFLGYRSEVKRAAAGILRHDYLVPAGPYEEQWDWDGFFIGMSLLSDIPSEAVYLKNWALNYLEHTDKKTGFTPGLLTPRGRDTRLHHIKPFLAQGVYFASRALNDFSWILPYWNVLTKSVAYREHNCWNTQYDLGVWYDSMESGADNNIAVLPYPKRTVIAVDLNTFLYREYTALARVASAVQKKKEAKQFAKRAVVIRKNIQKHLWNTKDVSYYNLDSRIGEHIRRHTYSNILPLWTGITPKKEGQDMIRRYLIHPKKLWARFGIRTLAKDDPAYNNKNMIKPHSNWQGPVWPIANYFAVHSLIQYGFIQKATQLATRIQNICFTDIKKTGGMHENYHADTGEPLAAPHFVSWNLLVPQMMGQIKEKVHPFALP